MLATTTNITQAMEEFEMVRPRQVMKQQQATLAAMSASSSGSNATTGSLELAASQGPASAFAAALRLLGITKRSSPDLHAVRVYYNTTTVRPMRQRVAGCMKGFTVAYGPMVTALLMGSLGLTIIGAVVGVALGVRTLLRARREGYQRVQLKEDVIFDVDADD